MRATSCRRSKPRPAGAGTSAASTSASTTCARSTSTRTASRATTRLRWRFLSERCERVLTATFPLDLGRPRAGWLAEGNAAVERNARAAGALLLDLRGFGARNLVMADHVHPTAFGQVAIAERALAVLAADGMTVRARPSALIAPSRPSRPRRLQGDVTYAYRHAKVSGRAAVLIARERLRAHPGTR